MIAAPKHRATRRTTLFALTAVKHHCVVHVAAATAAAVAAAADCAPLAHVRRAWAQRVRGRVCLTLFVLFVCVCVFAKRKTLALWLGVRRLQQMYHARAPPPKKTGSKYESAGMECLNVCVCTCMSTVGCN